MLTIRRSCSFLLATTAFLTIYSTSTLAAFRFSSLPENYGNYPTGTIITADNSLLTVKQQQPSSLLQQLNLTKKQKEQIEQIHSEYKQQILKKRNSLARLQQQLSDLMVGTEPVELVRAKNKQLVNLRQEIGQLRFESMLATREILTPQQRQKFREIIESQLSQ